jgi:hypothetical protein
MSNYFVPTKGIGSWKDLLANPEKQWKPGNSAYELALCWEGGKNLPSCVDKVFKESNISLLQDVKILYGFPEYKVSLPGGGANSQNDLYLLGKAEGELMTIMVEGKVSETFGEKVEVWIGENPSEGKRKRLEYLLNQLNLKEEDILNTRYQLLHRTASVINEAEAVNAKNALMLVHSFSKEGKWFEDYAEFVELFKLKGKKDSVVGPVFVGGVNLYFGWITSETVGTNSKEYFYSLFKTDKSRMLAKKVDDYIYKKSPYKTEVEDYHHRYKNGVRTDCIGYVSKKGSYKFATITAARKVCFVLHLGKGIHTETAKEMQREIDELLGHVYEKFDPIKLTPGEVYIRLEWVDKLEMITRFIDEAYKLRLQK